MRNAIGFLIILYGLSKFFEQGFPAFEEAAVASFGLVETAANVSTEQLKSESLIK